MPLLAPAPRQNDRSQSGFPPERVVNLFAEQAPTSLGVPFVYRPTPGLVRRVADDRPARGLFQADGSSTGDLIAVFGDDVYRVTTSFAPRHVGSMSSSTRPVRFAADSAAIAILDAPDLYRYNGASLALVSDADLPDLEDIAYLNGYYLGVESDSGRLVWSAVGNVEQWDALDFATAESSPDDLVAIVVDREEVWLLGSRTIEVWTPTGDADSPFLPRPGGVWQYGCASRDSTVSADNSFFWLGVDRIIYRMAEGPARVSTFYIEEELQALTSSDLALVRASTYADRGHVFVQYDLPGRGSFVYDTATQEWHRRRTQNRVGYRGAFWRLFDSKWMCADPEGGGLFEARADVYSDHAQEIRREATFTASNLGSRPPISTLTVIGTPGVGLDGSVQGSDPKLMLRISKDRGRTWSAERQGSIGRYGEYSTRTVFRRLGRIQGAQGLVAEIAWSDPVAYQLAAAALNERLA